MMMIMRADEGFWLCFALLVLLLFSIFLLGFAVKSDVS